ncbi:hypothetical protein OG21DRAFT_1513904 [Imleria badia]|nr:hypothetical protein OG21DRAFT_1513904 [Imleria badia]
MHTRARRHCGRQHRPSGERGVFAAGYARRELGRGRSASPDPEQAPMVGQSQGEEGGKAPRLNHQLSFPTTRTNTNNDVRSCPPQRRPHVHAGTQDSRQEARAHGQSGSRCPDAIDGVLYKTKTHRPQFDIPHEDRPRSSTHLVVPKAQRLSHHVFYAQRDARRRMRMLLQTLSTPHRDPHPPSPCLPAGSQTTHGPTPPSAALSPRPDLQVLCNIPVHTQRTQRTKSFLDPPAHQYHSR